MDKNIILKLDQVSYSYKSKYTTVNALTSVSIEFKRGRIYAITGKSGSGKTTLLSLLAGLDRPTSGTIFFEDNDLNYINLDEYRKFNLSVIYQDFHLFPLLTALENVTYPLDLQKVKSKEAVSVAKKLLDDMNLKEHCYKHFPNMLSGGEKQRVAIARALASNPKIILADEPTGNLDSENGANIMDILCDLAHKKNYCVFIVTHDMELANRADEVIHLKDGEIIYNI